MPVAEVALVTLKWSAVALGGLLPLLCCGVFTRLGAFKFLDTRVNADGNRELMVNFLWFLPTSSL